MSALLAQAIQNLDSVIHQGRAFNAEALAANRTPTDPPLNQLRFLCFESLRWYTQLKYLCDQLISKPLKSKDKDIELLLIISLCRLLYSQAPDYAVVSEAVEYAKKSKKHWAASLLNGCLRGFLRQKSMLMQRSDEAPAAHFAHPDWWIEKISRDWPDQYQSILHTNNTRAPMYLRVNQNQISRSNYLAQLELAGLSYQIPANLDAAILLETPCLSTDLPGFQQGLCSIQDGGAQQAAAILDAQDGDRVLDACAAPGGKAAHILELSGQRIQLTCVEIDLARHQSLRAQLVRLNLQANCILGDAMTPRSWWDGEYFDRILLDAPCSGSGVVRRHPDIKHLRRPTDMAQFAEQQSKLLNSLWPCLNIGGYLVYCTCSIFKQEGEEQIQHFLHQHPDADAVVFPRINGHPPSGFGQYILPGEQDMDGFYYAKLSKI